MSPRTRPVIARVRTVHRWISMTFVVVAMTLILPVLPAGPVFSAASAVAIALLLGLLVTGIWIAVHHYTVKHRSATRSRALN